jgi:hypothetical protein
MQYNWLKENLILLLTGLFISFVWVLIGKDMYSYNYAFFEVRGFDWFPFLVWGVGLYLIYGFYLLLTKNLKEVGFLKRLFIFLAIYWPILILAETVGYHFFGIHDLSTAAYPGLPICDCMHSPRWMQAVYFSLGPIYFFVCSYLKLINNPKNDAR